MKTRLSSGWLVTLCPKCKTLICKTISMRNWLFTCQCQVNIPWKVIPKEIITTLTAESCVCGVCLHTFGLFVNVECFFLYMKGTLMNLNGLFALQTVPLFYQEGERTDSREESTADGLEFMKMKVVLWVEIWFLLICFSTACVLHRWSDAWLIPVLTPTIMRRWCNERIPPRASFLWHCSRPSPITD